MSVQDELICVHLVMPRCMYSMQLFLSVWLNFILIKSKESCKESCIHNLQSSIFNTRATSLLHLEQEQDVHATVELAAHRSSVFNATFLPNRSDERQ